MGITFVSDRAFPREFSRMNGYGAVATAPSTHPDFTEKGAVDILGAISPFNLLKGLFVDKPLAERQAQLELTRIQAEAQGNAAVARSQVIDDMLKYAAIGIGALVVVILVTKRRAAPAKLAGYRRSKKSRRTRRSR